jgi:hypothetical protein
VTDLLLTINVLQVPIPLQAPDQPVKVESVSGMAVRATEVLWS